MQEPLGLDQRSQGCCETRSIVRDLGVDHSMGKMAEPDAKSDRRDKVCSFSCDWSLWPGSQMAGSGWCLAEKTLAMGLRCLGLFLVKLFVIHSYQLSILKMPHSKLKEC